MVTLKRTFVYVVCLSIILSGCGTPLGDQLSEMVGPQVSSVIGLDKPASEETSKPRLDIIIPVFDPGLPENESDYEAKGVWPELRRAEANRFAYKLKVALEATGAFGAVRVTPDRTATGELYILGRIEESDGEDVEIDLDVYDISGEHWFGKSFDHSVDAAFHKNFRNEGKDPYDPMFEEAAEYLVGELQDRRSDELTNLRHLAELRFGASFSEEAFSDHLALKNGRYTLGSLPSDDDPMLARIRPIRVRDQLFVDSLQDNYRLFTDQINVSYLVWQEQSLLENQAKSEAEMKAAGEVGLGILAIGVAIAAAVAGSNSNDYGDSVGLATASIVSGVAGVSLIQSGFQTSNEAKVHRDALNELGESIDHELAPRVIAFEKHTVELTGTAKEQFAQWRAFLKKIYDLEKTPAVKL